MLPPRSLPSPITDPPAATIAASPPLLPPGERFGNLRGSHFAGLYLRGNLRCAEVVHLGRVVGISEDEVVIPAILPANFKLYFQPVAAEIAKTGRFLPGKNAFVVFSKFLEAK